LGGYFGSSQDLVEIHHHEQRLKGGQLPRGHQGTEQMPRTNKDVRAKQPALASQYRAIGPAAIAAALLHTARKQKPAQKFIAPRAA
jgi:hypothetical protein